MASTDWFELSLQTQRVIQCALCPSLPSPRVHSTAGVLLLPHHQLHLGQTEVTKESDLPPLFLPAEREGGRERERERESSYGVGEVMRQAIFQR
jgi:hypothetical protein